MAKSRKLEETLAALNQIADPTSDDAIATLRKVIATNYGIAITQASRMIQKAEIQSLVPDLVAAFERCLIKPETTDPSCLAKKAIAETLYHLEYNKEELFLSGIRHVQREPVWGGRQDTAPALRSVCALGLVRMHYPLVLSELADLLADPEAEARIGAVRAIAYNNNPDAAPLLRLRVQIGDNLPVFSECLLALLKLTPEPALSLVTRFLTLQPAQSSAAEFASAAALALGEARLPQAFPPLQHWWERSPDPEQRRTALLAIAMLRQNEPLDFLLSLIAAGPMKDARDAIVALSIYQKDEVLWQRVRHTTEQRHDSQDFRF